jgi:tripartite ATP-independent transporter DctM subunit
MELFFLLMLVVVMATALGSGYPVAFALPGSAILTISAAALCGYLFAGDTAAYFSHGGPVQWLTAGVTNFRGVYWEVERDTLIAIPLFVFMGIMLQRSKIAEDLLVTMAQLFGPVPGGLGISVVFVGALLAATTGIVGATVVAMGLISLPAMLRNNYSHPLATGTIAASGTLGQIIPPSIVLIILADQLASAVDQADTARKALYKASTGQFGMPSEFGVISTSAGDMFLGAFIPGLVLVGLYMVYILGFSLLRPKSAPAVGMEGKFDRQFFTKVLLILIPPLTLIFLVLGSIIAGIATVNQAGAIGAVGAMVMAGYRLYEGRKDAFYPALLAIASLIGIYILSSMYTINIKNIQTGSDMFAVTMALIATACFLVAIVWSGWRAFKVEDTLRSVMVDTAKTTSLVFIILLGAAMLTAAFRAFGGEELVKEFLTGLPGGFWTQFIIVMAVIFVLGFFLDFIEIAVVVVPIVAPILLLDPGANVTAVWLGVMIGLNIQTSFLTPPFGFALFYLRGVAPAVVRTISMYKGVVAFIALQLLALVIVGLNPSLVNYLPNRLSLTSDTAPPPLNPRLQYCIEQYVNDEFNANGEVIRSAIADARKLDISYLPKKLQKQLTGSFDDADATFDALKAVFAAEQTMQQAANQYAPLHQQVRKAQVDMRELEALINELRTDARRANDDDRRRQIENRIAGHEKEVAELKASIPANWEDENKTFAELSDAYEKARKTYRRHADDAYEPILELGSVLAGSEQLVALREPVAGLRQKLDSMEPKAFAAEVAAVSRQVREVEGTSAIRSQLSKARKAMRARTPAPDKAVKALDKALELYDADAVWRVRAARELAPAIAAYDGMIGNTIGLRLLNRLPEDVSLYIASCNSGHRDISLNF